MKENLTKPFIFRKRTSFNFTINSRYPMEMHIVHIKTAFGDNTTQATDVEECTQNGRICGLAVVAILFHVGRENNTIMEVRTDYSNFFL